MKMNIEKVNPNIKYIYHYTLKKNVKKILAEQEIISKDQYVFFTKSLKDSIIAFEREMMQENKLYIDVNGNLKEEYTIEGVHMYANAYRCVLENLKQYL